MGLAPPMKPYAPGATRTPACVASASATLVAPRASASARLTTSVLTVERWERSGVRVPVTTISVSLADGETVD
jgi:hypothetical protein